MKAPEQPMGWPRAMAPPFGLVLAMSRPRPRETAMACAAKASLDSITSIWSSVTPPFFSASLEAGMGPSPITSLGTPATAYDTRRAIGL